MSNVTIEDLGIRLSGIDIITSRVLQLAVPVVVSMSKGKPGSTAGFFVELFAGSK